MRGRGYGQSNPFGVTLTPWVRRLLIGLAVVFVLTVAVDLVWPGFTTGWLAFRPVDVLSRPWTPLTYGILHGDPLHLLFNLLGLFFFGTRLEETWGAKPFLTLLVLSVLGGALFSGLHPEATVIGASAAVFGVMTAFAVLWPDAEIHVFGIFPVKAKWLVLGLIGIAMFYSVLGSRDGIAHFAHLGGAAAAFAYLKSPWGPSQWGRSLRSGGAGRSDLFQRLRARVRRPEIRRSHPTKPAPPATPTQSAQGNQTVDRILEKISQHGIASLTPEERATLNAVSQSARQRRPER